MSEQTAVEAKRGIELELALAHFLLLAVSHLFSLYASHLPD
jgi:hypothetical protein